MELIARLLTPQRWSSALGGAAWLGSLLGMTLMMLVTAILEGPPEMSELWAVPAIIFGYGTFVGLPVTLIGLLLVGVPLTFVLKRWAEQPWMPLLAFMAGGLAGRVMYHLVDHTVFFGIDDLWRWQIADYGVLIGAPTGLLWFFFARGIFRNQRA